MARPGIWISGRAKIRLCVPLFSVFSVLNLLGCRKPYSGQESAKDETIAEIVSGGAELPVPAFAASIAGRVSWEACDEAQ